MLADDDRIFTNRERNEASSGLTRGPGTKHGQADAG
jgi:hypothetical protein